MQTLPETIQLTALLSQQPGLQVLRRQLNQILHEKPEYRDTILALVLYPAFKWSLYGKPVINLMEIADRVDWATDLTQAQKIFQDVFGFGNALILKQRENQFKNSETLVTIIEAGVKDVEKDKSTGKKCASILRSILNIPSESPASCYIINTYTCLAVERMFQLYGTQFSTLIQTLLTPEYLETEEDGEYMFVYHNMSLLLKEYSRLMWSCCDPSDKISKILRCQTAEEVLDITEQISTIYSANKVLRFLMLITGSMALVQYWPINGPKYAKILKMLTANRNIAQCGSYTIRINEGDIARGLNLDPATFSKLKKQAFAILGLLLWGSDNETFKTLVYSEENPVSISQHIEGKE